MNPPNDPNNPVPPPQAYPPPGAAYPPPQGYPPPQPGYQQPGYPQSQPGAWPPPPGGQYDPNAGMGENTSGMKGPVPPELAVLKWNWGAFLLSFLWTVNHRMAWGWGLLVLGLLARIPAVGIVFSLANLGIAIYLGINGHKLGWQNRRFEGGLPQYFAVQDAWMKWGIGVAVVSLVFGVILGVAEYFLMQHGVVPSTR